MTRHLLVAAAALVSLTACGNTDLTARGRVIASYGGTERGFTFTENTRLEVPERDASTGFITGSCEMAQVGPDTWGIVVEIRGSGAPSDESPLTSVTIMQRTDAEPGTGHVEAVIGGETFTSGTEGCAIEIPYAERDSGMVGITGDCGVTNDAGDEASIAVELDLIGCSVLE